VGLIMAGCWPTLTLSLSWEVVVWVYKTVVSVIFCMRVGPLNGLTSALTCLYIIMQLVIGRVFFYFIV
jgi:hypothetical protein